jgi:hypothetical protein
MRITNAIILLLLSFNCYSQIKIDDVGDGWKSKVDSALVLIKTYDSFSYSIVTDHCNHITFWLNNFSSTQDPSTILIATKDMKIESINNLACLIVHEAHHLRFRHYGVIMTESEEELDCYKRELKFMLKLPNIEPWLIENAIKNIRKYSEN